MLFLKPGKEVEPRFFGLVSRSSLKYFSKLVDSLGLCVKIESKQKPTIWKTEGELEGPWLPLWLTLFNGSWNSPTPSSFGGIGGILFQDTTGRNCVVK